jgi:hypothetical protein
LSDVQSSLINRMSAKPDPFAATNAIQVRINEKGFLFSCPRVLSCTQFCPAP